MRKRTLGPDGPEITAVGFGAWAIGGLGYGDQDTDQAAEALDTYLGAGGRLIDTARGYGISEILVGQAVGRFGRRGEVFLASKSGSTHPPIVRTDLATSLFCLQADAVDLYYIHVPPLDEARLDATLTAYDQCKRDGRMRLLGVSLLSLRSPAEQTQAERIIDDPRVDVVQIPHSFAGPASGELIARAARRGLGVVTRSNLLGGILTGKYRPGQRFSDPANDWRATLNGPRLDEALEIVADLAGRLVRPPWPSLAQLALAYSLHTEGVSAIIPGARNARQVEANLQVDRLGPPDRALRGQLEHAGRQIADLLARARQEKR